MCVGVREIEILARGTSASLCVRDDRRVVHRVKLCVCVKEIFKRKSHSFSYLRSEIHLCVRGCVRVAHRGIVERNETRESNFVFV